MGDHFWYSSDHKQWLRILYMTRDHCALVVPMTPPNENWTPTTTRRIRSEEIIRVRHHIHELHRQFLPAKTLKSMRANLPAPSFKNLTRRNYLGDIVDLLVRKYYKDQKLVMTMIGMDLRMSE